jgi:peptide/nickel transport system permease protein
MVKKRLLFPLMILIGWVMLMVASPYLPLEPNTIVLPNILAAPSFESWLGFDDLGRPVWDRLAVGAKTSGLVAISVVSISLILGTLIGMFAAWFGGWIDRVIVHIVDVFLAFPGILLAIALAGMLGPGIENVVIALCVTGWIGFARLARAQTLSLKERDHVRSAKALGASQTRIIFKHIMPLLIAPMVIEATFGVASVVIAEAGLSFLGLGVQPPSASWGSMLRDGTSYMLVAPHLVIAPGLALMAVVLSVNLLGDSLRDYLDVKTK